MRVIDDVADFVIVGGLVTSTILNLFLLPPLYLLWGRNAIKTPEN